MLNGENAGNAENAENVERAALRFRDSVALRKHAPAVPKD